MTKRRTGIAAATILLGTGLIFGFVHERSAEAQKRSRTESRRFEETESQIAELRNELQRSQALSLLLKAKPPPNAPVEQAPRTLIPTPSALPSDAKEPAKAEVTTEDIRDGLNVRFTSEKVDTSWSQSARQKFSARLTDVLPIGSRLESIECKSSMCRAEITHSDLESHQRFIQTGFVSPRVPWEGATMVSLSGESVSGRVSAVAFFARDGQGLPLESDAPGP